MSFKPIETQEELNQIISERITREKKKSESQISELQTQIDEHIKKIDSLNEQINSNEGNSKTYNEKIASLEKQVAQYERDSVKTRVTMEMGLPFELSNRLNGETEEEIREDAEKLKSMQFFGTAPLGSTEPVIGDSREQALKELLGNIKK